MTEQWERWDPMPGLLKKYYAEKVIETPNGFSLMLIGYEKNQESEILLDFGKSVKAYRNVYETFRDNLIIDLDEKYGTGFYGEWTFFKVKNSEYFNLIEKKFLGTSPNASFSHFCLILAESVIDIIAYDEPKITVL